MPRSTHVERRPARAAEVLSHDLVELASPDAIASEAPLPNWVRASLGRAPFVVVRRAGRRGSCVPVGVRGSSRSDRFAAWLPASAIVQRIGPEDLATRRGWLGRREPQLSALCAVESLMAAEGLRWGPVGSAGFELATGVACVTPSSDLDLLVRAPAGGLVLDGARRLHAALAALPVRIDVVLETPRGGFALAEYAAGGSRLEVRTLDGPRWAPAPWIPGEAAP